MVEIKVNKSAKVWYQDSKKIWIFSIIWLLFITSIAFLINLGSIGLMDKTEPMFVEASRQMVVTGDWITPYWNGETRFDKPPLTYWLTGLSFKFFGINEWAARLPAALAAIAVVFGLFYTLKKFGIANFKSTKVDPTNLWITAIIGSAMITFNPFWIGWGRTGVSDMFLSSGIALSLLSFFLGYADSGDNEGKKLGLSRKNWYYLGFWVFMALGVLAKGPVAIVLPGLIVIAFLLYVGRFIEVVKETPWLLGIASFIIIAVPWFIAVTSIHGQEYIDTFFGLHNVQRFTSVVSRHAGGWYYYFPVVLVGFLPWSIYLPIAIFKLRFWQRKSWVSSPRSHHLGIFALCWFVIIFSFFSVSVTKLAGYVLPLMPAAAIMVALFWGEKVENKTSEKSGIWTIFFWLSILTNLGVLLGLAIASFMSPQLIGDDAMMPQFNELLAQSGLAIRGGIIWGCAALSVLILMFWRNYRRWIWVANLFGFMAFFTFVGLPVAKIVDSQRQLSLRQLSSVVIQERQPQERLVFLGFIRPSLVFYTQDVVDYISGSDIINGIALDYFSKENFHPVSTVLIISEEQYLDKLGLVTTDYQIISQQKQYKLIRLSKPKLLEKLRRFPG